MESVQRTSGARAAKVLDELPLDVFLEVRMPWHQKMESLKLEGNYFSGYARLKDLSWSLKSIHAAVSKIQQNIVLILFCQSVIA